MANTVPVIQPNAITSIKGKTDRPVYFVHLSGSPNPMLVIKGEGGEFPDESRAITIKWTSKVMKNVNNELVNTKIMAAAEIAEFKRAVTAAYPPTEIQWNFACHPKVDNTWVKMPYVAGLSDAEFRDKDDEEIIIPGKLKEAVQRMHADHVWEELGTIVAVDVFNGNNDRFNTLDGTWINYGNVMFVEGGKSPVIGLDTYDPNSHSYANVLKTELSEGLKAFMQESTRNQLITNCLRSVGETLKASCMSAGVKKIPIVTQSPDSKKHKFKLHRDELPEYFLQWHAEMKRGFETGMKKLKQYLEAKVRKRWEEYMRWEKLEEKRSTLHRSSARPNMSAAAAAAAPPPSVRLAAAGGSLASNFRPRPEYRGKTIPPAIIDRMEFVGFEVVWGRYYPV